MILHKATYGALLAMLATPALANETITYSYDALGRLVTASHAGSVNSGLAQSYTYDPASNRTNVTVSGSPYSTTARFVALPILGVSLMLMNTGH